MATMQIDAVEGEPALRGSGARRRAGPRGPADSRGSPGPGESRRWSSLSGGLAVGIVIGGTLVGAVGTLAAGRGPGALLGTFVLIGTIVATLAVRRESGRLILPVPVLCYLVAALAVGIIHDHPTSMTALGVDAAQWIASGFVTMAFATALAVVIFLVRWFLWRRGPGRSSRAPRPSRSSRPSQVAGRRRRPGTDRAGRKAPDEPLRQTMGARGRENLGTAENPGSPPGLDWPTGPRTSDGLGAGDRNGTGGRSAFSGRGDSGGYGVLPGRPDSADRGAAGRRGSASDHRAPGAGADRGVPGGRGRRGGEGAGGNGRPALPPGGGERPGGQVLQPPRSGTPPHVTPRSDGREPGAMGTAAQRPGSPWLAAV
jgi:hypothetical protein